MPKANLFHIGPQKTGTTWLYRALKEHGEISTFSTDAIHFFNMNFHKGVDWYHEDLEDTDPKTFDGTKNVFDPTPSYIRDKKAPQRIYNYNPNAKIMFTARNPIERAFSHYWHEKKKDRFNFSFEEIFKNYDLFANWVEPGFYATHYKRYSELFGSDNVKIFFFDDLNTNPAQYLQEVCRFFGISDSFTPTTLNKKVNEASSFKSQKRRTKELSSRNKPLLNLWNRIANKLLEENYKETLLDVDANVKNELLDIFYDEITELEKLTSRDLTEWKKPYEK